MKIFDFIVCMLAFILQIAGSTDVGTFLLVFLIYIHVAGYAK